MTLRFTILPLPLLIFAFHLSTAKAQCPTVALNTLQVIQNTSDDQKENKILEEGFDLRQSITQKGAVTHVYTRCWLTSQGQKDFYSQKIFWNQGDDSIKLALSDQTQFQTIRQSLDERHPSGAGATVIVGKMYKYYLGSEKIDGLDYYTLTVAKK